MPADVIINPNSGEIYWNDGTGTPQSISIRGDSQNKIDIIGYSASFSPGGSGVGTFVIATFNDNSGGLVAFAPGSTGNELGSSTLRWKPYLTTTTISDSSSVLGTNTSSLLTGLVQINGGIAISGSASIGGTILFFNRTNSIFYAGLRASSSLASTTIYTLPLNYPGTGTSVLISDTSGNLDWAALFATTAGSATTAQNVQVNLVGNANIFHSVLLTPTVSSAGSAVSGNGTLTYNTQSDILSTPGLAVTSGANSTSTTSGAFQVKGGVGITGNAFIGGTINVASPLTIPNGGTNVSSFGQSAGFIYYDGVNVRLLAATGATINFTNGYYQFDSRVYATSFFAGGAQMPNGSGTAGRVTIWSGNNTIGSDAEFTYDATNNILTVLGNINAIGFTASGVAVTSALGASSTSSGALTVTGGLALGGNAFIGGSSIQSGVSWINNSTNATSISSAALYVTGGLALGSNAFIGGTVYSTSTAWFNNSTPSISTSTGTLIVTGGVGIGGSLYTNTASNSSISGVNHLNSVITSGSWAATAITTAYGGVGAIPVVSKGDILVGAGNTWYNLPYSASNSQVLTVDTATAFGVKWSAVTAAASSVSVASATGNTVVFLTATNADTGSGFALSTSTALSYNPSVSTLSSTGITATSIRALNYLIPIGGNNIAWYASDGTTQLMGINTSNGWLRSYQTTNATTTGSAALVSSGGLAVATNAFIGGTFYSVSTAWFNNSTTSTSTTTGTLIVGGGVGIGGSLYVGGQNRFSGARDTTSTTSGTLVIDGGLGITGSAFIGGSTYITGIEWVNNSTSSSTTSSGALIVTGGLGLGGNAFIGGTVNITNTTQSAYGSSTSGAVVVAGSVGIGGSVYIGGQLGVGGTLDYLATGNVAYFAGNNNSYTQVIVHNHNSGNSASSDFIVSNDSATDSAFFGDFGMNSSGWAATTAAYNTANAVYLASHSGDLAIGSLTSNAIRFFFNNGTSDAVAMGGAGMTIFYGTTASSTTSGALQVRGGLGITGNAFIGGSTHITGIDWINNSTNATSTASGALIVTGGLALGSNAFIGGTFYSTSTAWFNNTTASINTTTGTLIVNGGVGIGGSLYLATSVPSNISGIYVANGVLSGSALTATSNITTTNIRTTASTLNIVDSGTTNTVLQYNGTRFGVLIDVNSTASNNGGLVVTGGAGFGASINVNGNIGVRSGFEIRLYNPADNAYAGFDFTGSGSTTYILPPSSPATGTSVLQSTAGGVMSWVPMATGSGSPGGSNSQIQFNSGGTFAGAVGISYEPTLYLTSIASTADQRAVTTVGLRLINHSTVSVAGVQQRYSPALELVGKTIQAPSTEFFNRFTTDVFGAVSSYAAQQQWKYSYDTGTASYSNPLFIIHSHKGIGIGQSSITFQSFFRANASQASELLYVLPVAYPGTGTSVLSSDTTGNLSWVPMTTGGSGTPGGSTRQIQYNNGGVFGGASGFEYQTVGNAVTVNIFATAGGGLTSGLSINTINGTTTRIGIGLTNPAFELEIRGEISATNKSFVIDHPTKPDMKLRYGSLEGPENGVYVRGQLFGTNVIETPDYWRGLVHDDSYTIHLTPIGNYQQLYIDKIQDYKVYVGTASTFEINCFYSVWAERKDISKLIVEY